MSSTPSDHDTPESVYRVADAELYRLLMLQERVQHAATRVALVEAKAEAAIREAEAALDDAKQEFMSFMNSEFASDVSRSDYAFPETFEVSETSRLIPLTKKV